MKNNLIFGIIFMLIGLFSLISSIKDWNFFFGSYKAKRFVSLLGRNGARIFFGLLGITIAIVGILAIYGKIDLAKDF